MIHPIKTPVRFSKALPIAVSAAQVGHNRKFYSERFAKTEFCRFVFCIADLLEKNSFVCDFHPFSIPHFFPGVLESISGCLEDFCPIVPRSRDVLHVVLQQSD